MRVLYVTLCMPTYACHHVVMVLKIRLTSNTLCRVDVAFTWRERSRVC